VRNVAVLGSTGSIGQQALEVIRLFPERFQIEVLTAQSSSDLLLKQAREFKPNAVVIGKEELYPEIMAELSDSDIKVFSGQRSLEQVVEFDSIDIVLNALVGYPGFRPTIAAASAGKTIALANKESLVVGGELVSKVLQSNHATIIPVDSEHSAIFQCLMGESIESVSKLYLTASGGPFRNIRPDELEMVTKEQALKHPNWNMGDKITVDSASLMNKGLEVIEAHWLFGVAAENIEVVIHPQSVVHSLVEFRDGSLKAQLGLPDMRLPIQLALTYPERLPGHFPDFNFLEYPELTFYPPDTTIFRNLALAFQALKAGGNAGCILNASNEEAVRAFLAGQIGFMDIPGIVEHCLEKIQLNNIPAMDVYEQTDADTRRLARHLIKSIGSKK
jgi:1-deoxy-D-xylulose-5-phosphate reductoisomerase